MNKNEVTPVQIAIRIIIVIVIIIILVFVSFAMVRFVPKVLSSLSNFRNIFAAKEQIVLALDETSVAQKEETGLSYRQTGGKAEGHYELSYSCSRIDSKTRLEVQVKDRWEVLGCDQNLYLAEASTSTVSRKAHLKTENAGITYDQPIELTVTHVNASSTPVSSKITLTVLADRDGGNDTGTAATSTPSTSNDNVKDGGVKATTAPVRPAASGTSYSSYYTGTPADLRANFVSATNNGNQQATLTFHVTNYGGRPSGLWAFSAIVPRDRGTTVFNSGYQSSIPPGGTSVMFLTFDNAKDGQVTVTINGKTFTAQFNFR